jgi:hypothetical protein
MFPCKINYWIYLTETWSGVHLRNGQ